MNPTARIIAGYIFAYFIVLFLTVLTAYNFRNSSVESIEYKNTLGVLHHIETFYTALLESDESFHNYLSLHDDSSLRSYSQQKQIAIGTLDSLQQFHLVGDKNNDYLIPLRKFSEQKIKLNDSALKAVSRNVFKSLSFASSNERETMNSIQQIVSDVEARGRKELKQFSEFKTTRDSGILIGFVSLLGALFLFLIIYRVRSERFVRLSFEEKMKADEQYRMIVNSTSEGIWVIDENGNTLFVNDGLLKMFGYTKNEMLGKSMFKFMSDDERAAAEQNMKRRESGIAEQHEFKFLKRDKTELWTAISTNPLYDSRKKFVGALAMVTDITERKNAETELARSESRTRSFIEQASDPIMITDFAGNFMDVNSSLCKMFGYEKEELLHMNIRQLIDAEQLKNQPINFEGLRNGAHVFSQRNMLHRDGTIIYVEANVKKFEEDRVMAIARDVTDRMKAQEQILKEKLLSDFIINSLPGVFYLFNQQGKYLRWNRNLETVSGYSGEEIGNRQPSEFFEGDDIEKIEKAIRKVFEEGEVEVEAFTLTKDGRKIPYFYTGFRIEYEGEICLLGVGIDISDRRKAEEEVRNKSEQLRQLAAYLQNAREEERKNIAREIHDELGQLLTGLKMDVSWLKNKIPSPTEEISSRINDVLQLTDRTIQSVRKIATELRPGILDDLGLQAAIEWQVQEFAQMSGINCELKGMLHDKNYDATQSITAFRILQESLTNILRHANATKVFVHLAEASEFVSISILDDGKGIASLENEKKESLGIVGMQERAVIAGGTLMIESLPEKGTTVTLKIPFAKKIS